ncbi:hypothetical protein I3760_03G137200 [Carya illinoinensis]|nr:hypothetical protein I3760_03G137200 [Carya illinoinensis]
MSIEALAMAGIDYKECSIKLNEWEKGGFYQQPPPPHLLAEQNFGIHEVEKVPADADTSVANGECVKAWMREWAKAVAAMNQKQIETVLRFEMGAVLVANLYSL